MNRRTFLISLLMLSIALSLHAIELRSSSSQDACVQCHEKIYSFSISSPYRHSVAMINCATCHVSIEPALNQARRINYPVLQRQRVLYIDNIDYALNYKMEIVLTDDAGVSCEPHYASFTPKDLWEFDDKLLPLTKISDVQVKEVRKSGFVNATISWTTDSYASSEIEYGISDTFQRRAAVDNQFAKKHKIILRGLKHKSKYRYRVISKDIRGVVVKSDGHALDTSHLLSSADDLTEMEEIPPSFNSISIFRAGNGEGAYVKISANKPSEVIINLTKLNKLDEKHGNGLFPLRYSTIEVCYTCHPQGASHPVGIRSRDSSVIIPDTLPTIEDGVITCVTCHDPHGSRKKFFVRLDYRKDLCIQCHTKGY